MVQSHSWEANWFAASQEILRISGNPKVHYRTHKRPPPVSILGQPNPVHMPASHLLEIQPNIIHASTPRSPQWSPSLRFPHQDPIHPPLLTHTRHMPSSSHSSRFYHPHNIGLRHWLQADIKPQQVHLLYSEQAEGRCPSQCPDKIQCPASNVQQSVGQYIQFLSWCNRSTIFHYVTNILNYFHWYMNFNVYWQWLLTLSTGC